MNIQRSAANKEASPSAAFGCHGFADEADALDDSEHDYRMLNLEISATLADAAPVGLALIEPRSGAILSINQTGAELLGIRTGEAIGRRAGEFLAERRHLRSLMVLLRRTRPMTDVDLRLKSVKGRQFWAQVSARPTKLDGQTHFVISAIDISRHKRREKTQQNACNHAESALNTLRQSQAALIEAVRLSALRQLTAEIAHGLNTPVGIGVTGASLLKRKATEIRQRLDDGELTAREMTRFVALVEESSHLLATAMNRTASLIDSFRRLGRKAEHGEGPAPPA